MTDDQRRNWLARLLAVSALVVLATGCFGGGGDEPATADTTAAAPAPERRFAELKVVYDNGLDYLDPALSYTVHGGRILWHTHLGLLTYPHVDGPEGASVVPALAAELPEISEDGRTYRFRLREGLTYSNGAEVKASDFEYTIKRLFRMDSLGAGFYTGIEGAERYLRTKRGDISGIVTNDGERTVEIRLVEPQGDFLHALAMTFAAFVPSGTDDRDQSEQGIPATGPYMIESYTPNERIVVVRNPEWRGIPGLPDGNPDRMTFDIVADGAAALDGVIDGKWDYDFHPIPLDRLEEVREHRGDQLKLHTPANTYYFFMNTRLKPFDRLDVRQAVNYAIDRDEVVRLYGGLATPTQNVLPPTYPQYEPIDMYPYDLERAKRLMRQSGYVGTQVTVWANSRDTIEKPAQYLVEVLRSIGLRATLKVVDPAVYWTTIGNQRTRAQIGIANWFQDYPHPLNWFDTLLNGSRITEERNNNYANADVREINELIEELKREPELDDEVNERWARVDELVMENALWAPVVNRQFTDFFHSSMDIERCYVNHVLYQFDYALACKKE